MLVQAAPARRSTFPGSRQPGLTRSGLGIDCAPWHALQAAACIRDAPGWTLDVVTVRASGQSGITAMSKKRLKMGCDAGIAPKEEYVVV